MSFRSTCCSRGKRRSNPVYPKNLLLHRTLCPMLYTFILDISQLTLDIQVIKSSSMVTERRTLCPMSSAPTLDIQDETSDMSDGFWVTLD